MIQAVFRGWRTRQLVSLTKKHFEDQCSQIVHIVQLDCRQYEHRSASFTGRRLEYCSAFLDGYHHLPHFLPISMQN
jgi:hypothetical protein